MKQFFFAFPLCLAAVIAACTHDSYETGDGSLSYMRADFADITVSNNLLTDIRLDDDSHLIPPSNVRVNSAAANDTVMRYLLYYNKKSNDEAIELLKTTPVSVVKPHDKAEIDEMKTDPLKLTSAYLSANRRYLNLQLGLMTGNTINTESRQKVQFVTDSLHIDGRGAIYLTLYHDQAGIEQYYTEDVYASLPLNALVADAAQPDTIHLTVNTYSGTVTKTFIK